MVVYRIEMLIKVIIIVNNLMKIINEDDVYGDNVLEVNKLLFI